MKLSQLLSLLALWRVGKKASPKKSVTIYHHATRRRGGVTEVGIPNKIARRMMRKSRGQEMWL